MSARMHFLKIDRSAADARLKAELDRANQANAELTDELTRIKTRMAARLMELKDLLERGGL
jgi:hypothetical protein